MSDDLDYLTAHADGDRQSEAYKEMTAQMVSDRIDELVGYIRADIVDRGGAMALTELATITREAEAQLEERININSTLLAALGEAEAMCEWLAEEATSSDFHHKWTTADERLAAAREAVAQK